MSASHEVELAVHARYRTHGVFLINIRFFITYAGEEEGIGVRQPRSTSLCRRLCVALLGWTQVIAGAALHGRAGMADAAEVVERWVLRCCQVSVSMRGSQQTRIRRDRTNTFQRKIDVERPL